MNANKRSRATVQAESLNEGQERDLMFQIAGRNHAAFREFVTAFRPLIQSVVERTIWNHSDAEDVCQTVYLAVWNGAGAWNPAKGRVSTWVASVARNRSIDHVRKASRAAALRERLTNETATLSTAHHETAADEELVRTETRRVTRHALRELAPEQRQLIELAFIEGLTQVEVAERAGLPLGTTKARIRRGIMSLRRSLPHRLAA